MQKKFLLVRTDRIGDLISITPAISVLRRNFPHAHIAVLVSPYAADVIKNNNEIDEVILKGPFLKTLAEVRGKKFDAAIIFFLDAYCALLTFLAAITARIGPRSKIWALFLSKSIRQNRSSGEKHEADYNTALLKPLFVYYHPVKTKIFVPKKDDIKAKNYLKEKYGIDMFDDLVFMHPGSKGSSAVWSAENYALLARKIMQNYPTVKLLLTGGPDEQRLLEHISAKTKPFAPFVLKDSLPLEDFIALINQCAVFISNSTGPLHIAAALGKKTLSFFSNEKACLPRRWGPYGKGRSAVLQPPEQACSAKNHKCTEKCMHLISVDAAFDAFSKLLKDK
ncbi:MAG: glycosyltransferase family 9 protein [Elusimicrobium sp.]|jgi:ADP-heptose:LPS heptosyltransferase|nr:glycosyltransferase family 9 protein [Elusimicrobium sp.]